MKQEQLIQSPAVALEDHNGRQISGGRRIDLSRNFKEPHFCHFATDMSGAHLITDCGPFQTGGRLFYARLPESEKDAIDNWIYLCSPGHEVSKRTHVHPFLSPDGTMGFFNSAESGLLQAYMITGLDNL